MCMDPCRYLQKVRDSLATDRHCPACNRGFPGGDLELHQSLAALDVALQEVDRVGAGGEGGVREEGWTLGERLD